MKTLTVHDVEEQLLNSLLDLHEELLSRQLDCSDSQALAVLRKYQEVEADILMMLYPDSDTKDEDTLQTEYDYTRVRALC